MSENPPDDNASYVEDATSGGKTFYHYGSVSGLGTVYGVQITTTAQHHGCGKLGF